MAQNHFTQASLRILIVLCLLISIVACTQGSNVTLPKTGGTDLISTPISGGGSEAISFTDSEYRRALYEPIIKEFNKQNPNITVQFVATPSTSLSSQNANNARIQASDADVSLVSMDDPSLKNGNYYRDLHPLIEGDSSFDPDDFWQGTLSGCQNEEGRSLGVPLNLTLYGIFYDEQSFDAAGLAHPFPGWNYDDFRNAITILANKNGDTSRYVLVDGKYLSISILGPWIEYRLAQTHGKLDPIVLQKDVQWYLDLVKSQTIFPIQDLSQNQTMQDNQRSLFKSTDRPAIWPGLMSDPIPGDPISQSQNDPFQGLAIEKQGFVPYPVITDGSVTHTTPVAVQCVGISAGSKHPRAAWTWVNFLTHQWLTQDKSRANDMVQVPARRSVTEKVNYWKNIPAKAEPAVRYILEHAWITNNFNMMFDVANNAIVKTMSGKSDFVAALDEAERDISTIPQPTFDSEIVVVATPVPKEVANSSAIVIQYFLSSYDPREIESLKVLAEQFNQEQQAIQVQLQTDYGGSTITSQDPIAEAAEKYDCFLGYQPYWNNQKTDNLLNLDPMFEIEGQSFSQDFTSQQLDLFRKDGVHYGLPATSQPLVMAYNADLLAKRGLKMPSNNWTFDDFSQMITLAGSIREDDKSYGYVGNINDPLFFENRGVRAFDPTANPPAPKFNSSEMINTLTWMAALIKSGGLLLQTNENWNKVNDIMTSGQIAFWIANAGQLNSSWFLSPDQKPPFKIGVVPMPVASGVNASGGWSADRAHFISQKSKNPLACWNWIKFISEQPIALDGIPARHSVINSPAWEASVGSETAAVYKLTLSRVKPHFLNVSINPINMPFSTWRSQTVLAVFKGEDPKLVLTQTQKKAEDYLSCLAGVDSKMLDNEALNKKISACAKQVDPEGNWP